MTHKVDLPSPADFARLEGQLFDRIGVRYRRQVIRHRLVAAAAVLVLAGTGVAAGTIANPTQQSKFAYCYSGSTTNSRTAQLTLPTDRSSKSELDTADTQARVASALFICEAAWRGGVFNASSISGPFPVPKLQVCLRDDLIVSVFRKSNAHESADAFCNRLGLSAP